MVRTISIDAYHEHLKSGKALKQWQKIYAAMKLYKPLTRSELSDATGIRLSSVCGRVNELIEAGLVVEHERRKCTVTGRAAHPVGIAPVASHNQRTAHETENRYEGSGETV